MGKVVVTRDLGAWSEDLTATLHGLPMALRRAARKSATRLKAEAWMAAPRHTGALRRSIGVSARATDDGAELAITSNDPAAGIQERGGHIRSSARAMLVPIGEERAYWDRSGTRREASAIAGLFKIRARDGREYLVTRRGRTIVPRFALRWHVYQDGQGWATKAAKGSARYMLPGIKTSMQRSLLAVGEGYTP